MVKKVISMLFMGSIALALSACGNEQAGQNQQSTSSHIQANPAEAATAASYKTIFQNSVFLGDSITEGLSYHDILEEANVMGDAGKITELALEDIDDLTKRNPKHVFIMLGSDDLLLPPQITDNPMQYSLKYYEKLIEGIKRKLPEASITVLSVTPVTAEVEQETPAYKHISEYNHWLKELAAKQKIAYADVSSIASDDQDVYTSDGIHFKPKFYTRMLDFLKDQVN
ncbi:lipase [Brevibacillus reuszeri]|uniref:Lipase n=1 Tax=Brevibacillus reuszeri TaxID=54915 RepID=A0A0K9YY61_9BACL|nr:GDSL-type esterase/lipase family protein [Brevibacillus reuszeri]KNB73596.1 lysophospholipase [Brevibacillus reuszeri]MED1858601.1 GDSL-type esterase/lipase family protein [Brevibacillus reuszeri]GED69577.1 lipase [Brevibacillus reuszeri]